MATTTRTSRIRKARTLLAASTAAASLALGSAAANAEDLPPGAAPESVLSQVAPDSLEAVADVETTDAGINHLPEEGVTAEVPINPNDQVTIASDAGAVGIELPFADQAELIDTKESGVIAFDNGNDTTTAVVVHDDSSVQINTIIDSAESPTRYDYPLSVPEGGNVSFDKTGAIIIADANGNFVAGIARPWAKDANGNDVATHYEVNGSTLTQIVEHTSAKEYPVVADPYFGIALVSKAVWAKNLWQYSPTLKVYPTAFGRNVWWGAPPAARWAA